MVMATNQGMFTNQSSAPSSGFVYAVGNRTFNTAEEAKQYLARNPGAGTISRVPFQNVTGPTTSGPFNVPTTPTGQQRGGGMMQNITTPAPTKQAPIIVGTPAPTSTTKRTAGDTGPIIANPGGMLPIPPATTKTPEPTKQAPIIVGTPDPVKTTKGTYESPPIISQPGQIPLPGPGETVEEDETRATEQFDEMGEEEPKEITTFTFVEGRERGGQAQNYLYGQTGEVQQVTVDELRDYFESDKVNRLPEVFGTFENYLAYMTEREQLIRSGDYDIGNWSEADAGFTPEQEMLLAGEDLFIDPSDPMQDPVQLERIQRQTQVAAYENWIKSEANQALLQKYGVSPVVYSKSGDKFQWNGSGYVKTQDVKGLGFGDYFKAAVGAAFGYFLGPAIGGALTGGATGAGTAAATATGTLTQGAVNAMVGSAISQGITTGSIDPKQLLQSAATAGFAQAFSEIAGPAISDALSELNLPTTTNIEGLDNVLSTMGETALRQAVFDGEIELDEVITSGVFAAAVEFTDWLIGEMAVDPEKEAELVNNLQGMTDELNQETFEAIERQFGEGALTDALNQMDADIASMLSENLSNMFAANNIQLEQTNEGIFQEVEISDPTQITQDQRGISWTPSADSPTREVAERWISDDQRPEGYEAMGVEDTYLANWTGSDATGEYYLIDTPDGYYVTDGVNVVKYRGTAADLDNMSWLDSHFYGGGGLPKTSSDTRLIVDFIETNNTTSEWDELFESIEAPDQIPNPVDQPDILEADFSVDPIVIEPEPITPEPSVEVPEQQIPPQEDIFADTIQGETGLEASIIEDLFSDYMEDFRQQFEMQQSLSIDQVQEVIANTLGNVQQPENLTPEQVQEIVNSAVASIPQADTLSEEQVQQIVTNAINAIEMPESITTEDVSEIVNQAIAGMPAGTSPDQVQEIVNQAISGIEIPEGMTPEQVQTIVDTAVSNIQFPEGISAEDVQGIVNQAIASIEFPEIDTLSTNEVQSIVDAAIGGIQFPEGVTADQVLEIIQAQLAAQPEGLSSNDVNEIVSSAISSIQFPESVTQEEVNALVNQVQENVETSLAQVGERVTDVERSLQDALQSAQAGQARALSEAEARLLSEITGVNAQTLQQLSAVEGGLQRQLEQMGSNLGNVQSELESSIAGVRGEVRDVEASLQNALAAQAAGQARQLTDAEARLLSQITGVEANTLRQLSTVEGALNNQLNQLGTNIAGVQNQLEQSIAGIAAGQQAAEQERKDLQQALIAVGGDVNRLDAQTRQQFEAFGEDVNQLFAGVNVDIEGLRAGQISQQEAFEQYQASAATQAAEAAGERRNLQQSIINVQGDVSQLDESTRQQFQEFGGTVNQLFSDVDVDINALQAGQISQAEAQQAFEQSVAGQFGGIEGQITELSGQLGGLMSDVAGIGRGLEGLGEGVAGLGQGLGAGLLGLAAAQPTAQQIASAMPRQPVKFDPFFKGLSPFQPLTPLSLSPVQEKDALSELNKFIGRQSGMLV
jgi:hypothetical protein